MVKITKKVYKLNEDYVIECITTVSITGKEMYSLCVKQLGLPKLEVAEEHGSISSREEANRVFESLRNRYKNPMNKGYFRVE